MALKFQSLRSSSAGNCLLLQSDKTSILIDCGLGSMKNTEAVLSNAIANPSEIDAVIVSHNHGDHIGYYPLRVLNDKNIPVMAHQKITQHLIDRHTGAYLDQIKILSFCDKEFSIKDFHIKAFKIPHHPSYTNYGFIICHENKKIVVATDFHNYSDVFSNFLDCDFIFLESNHDLELLRKNFNPNSLYHLPNPKAAELLLKMALNSKKIPPNVMIGHISKERNTEKMAIKEIKSKFKENHLDLPFRLTAAPLVSQSNIIEI